MAKPAKRSPARSPQKRKAPSVWRVVLTEPGGHQHIDVAADKLAIRDGCAVFSNGQSISWAFSAGAWLRIMKEPPLSVGKSEQGR